MSYQCGMKRERSPVIGSRIRSINDPGMVEAMPLRYSFPALAVALLCALLGSSCAGLQSERTQDTATGGEQAAEDGKKMRCLKVCKEWQRRCVTDDRGVNNCRRSCVRFGEECFEVKAEPK